MGREDMAGFAILRDIGAVSGKAWRFSVMRRESMYMLAGAEISVFLRSPLKAGSAPEPRISILCLRRPVLGVDVRRTLNLLRGTMEMSCCTVRIPLLDGYFHVIVRVTRIQLAPCRWQTVGTFSAQEQSERVTS